VRFIRKGGRIIPIKEYKQQGNKTAKRGLIAYGAATATEIGAAAVAGHALMKQNFHAKNAKKWAINARQAADLPASPKFPEVLSGLNQKMFKNAAHSEMRSALKYGARGTAAVKVIKATRIASTVALGVAAYGAFKSLGFGHKKKV